MLRHIFPEKGWYLYVTQQFTGVTEIEGPYTQEEATALIRQRRTYFVSIHAEHHWRAPEGVVRRARWGEEVKGLE